MKRIRRLSFKRWNEIRFAIWVRDNYRCTHCERYVGLKKAHIDHILPISKGGGNGRINLRTLCYRCHALRKDSAHDKLRRKAFSEGIIPKDFWKELWGD